MNELTHHRGPDSNNIYVNDKFSFGHNRLAIIDLNTTSDQPMVRDGYVIIFNGEIYNYSEIRVNLINLGYIFTTNSDTEVLLNGYIHYGSSIVEILNGIFSFCIYDPVKDELLLARDRFGVKQFYYREENGNFYFSSEIKPLLINSLSNFNNLSIFRYLISGSSPLSSFFSDIKKALPGEIITFNLKTRLLNVTRYYNPSLVEIKNYKVTHEELAGVIDRAVKNQTISDVKYGVICSGGIDSSLISAIVLNYKPDVEIYFCNVDHDNFSEYFYVKNFLEKYPKVKFHVANLSKKTFLDNLVDCIYYNEEPLTHPNSVGVRVVSMLASTNGCKVLLNGEGADELFGGYIDRYKHSIYIKKFFSKINYENNYLKAILQGILSINFPLSYLNDLLIKDPYFFKIKNELKMRGYSSVDISMLVDLSDYMQPILLRQDKMAMSASIESRVPFLDNSIVKLAHQISVKNKISLFGSKIILKKVASIFLPKKLINRKKCGFSIPLKDWLNINKNFFEDGFVSQYLNFDSNICHELCHDSTDLMWRLINIEIWGRIFILKQNKSVVKQQFLSCMI